MTNKQMEARLRKLVRACEDDFEEIEDFISENEADYEGDLGEYAFRQAVKAGLYDYVEEHLDDYELNDSDDGYSTYLDETEDEDIIDLLLTHGAYRDPAYYEDFSFACESINGEVYAFSGQFQWYVFEQYMEKFGLNYNMVEKFLREGGEEPENFPRSLSDDLKALGIILGEDGELTTDDKTCAMACDGIAIKSILEELGYACEFEGQEWFLESGGVYYLP